LRRFQNLFAVITILSLFPPSSFASEKTLLFKLRYDAPPAIASNHAGNKRLGHREVIENLRTISTISQSDFSSVLESTPGISGFERFWIANIVKVTGDSITLMALALRSDVESVYEDFPIELIAPVEAHETSILNTGHENGLTAIKAPQAWSLGLDGTGSLVCNFDTGVDGDHAALSPKYRGNHGGEPAACWFDPYSQTSYPTDNNGHGTHTMGTMVGSDGSDTVGVAPGAQWIAAAVVDRGGGIQRTISDLLLAFQWAADPDGNPETTDDVPDVVNNSWGIPLGYYPPCEATFWDAIDNLEAAGVVCLFAAGNEGSNPSTMRIPADRVTSNFNSFSVGAVDGNNPALPVADYSSRGPSACDHSTIKPEVTAPGESIRSTSYNGGYTIMSGTSMATPHVAGAVAILRQFNPDATPVEIKQALMNSAADLGQPGEDNDYGWGVIDIRRALYYMPTPSNPFLAITSQTISGDGVANPGDSFELGIAVENIGASVENLRAHISCSNPEVQILSGDVNFESLGHFDTSNTVGWTILFSNELNLGDVVTFEIDFATDSWTSHQHIRVLVGDLATAVVNQGNLPESSKIIANYPNPFNGSTLIQIEGQSLDNETVTIFDNGGRLVKSLNVNGSCVVWDGTDSKGSAVATGIYFAKMIKTDSAAKKMVLVK
jgi:subtilisin family serine protease